MVELIVLDFKWPMEFVERLWIEERLQLFQAFVVTICEDLLVQFDVFVELVEHTVNHAEAHSIMREYWLYFGPSTLWPFLICLTFCCRHPGIAKIIERESFAF